MDRNTITGLVVIALILIGYSYFMSPSKEELKAMPCPGLHCTG